MAREMGDSEESVTHLVEAGGRLNSIGGKASVEAAVSSCECAQPEPVDCDSILELQDAVVASRKVLDRLSSEASSGLDTSEESLSTPLLGLAIVGAMIIGCIVVAAWIIFVNRRKKGL